jgi:hypothetical protein
LSNRSKSSSRYEQLTSVVHEPTIGRRVGNGKALMMKVSHRTSQKDVVSDAG